MGCVRAQRLRRRGEHRLADQRAVGAGGSACLGDGAVAGAHLCRCGLRGPGGAGAERRRRADAGVDGRGGRVMDAPHIQYVKTTDGVSIAFWTLGEGPPLVVLPRRTNARARGNGTSWRSMNTTAVRSEKR